MQTAPSSIAALKRTGPYGYAIEIVPRAGDSWSEMRYASDNIYIDDNEFLGDYLSKTSRISNTAKIREAGAGVTKDNVNFELLNIDKHHETFIANGVLGRRVNIWIVPLGLNRISNSSFERKSGSAPVEDFEDWTENTPGTGGTITQTSSDKKHGTYSLLMTYATTAPAPQIFQDFKIKRGEYISVSFWARTLAGTSTVRVYLYNATLNKFYDFVNSWTTSTYDDTALTTTWTRVSYIFHWKTLTNSGLDRGTLETDIRLYLSCPTMSTNLLLDAVLVEPHPELRDYVPHINDLLTEDIMPVYTGEVRSFNWNRDRIRVETNSILDIHHKTIPVGVLTDESNANWNIPPDNHGKPFPITYGDLKILSSDFFSNDPRAYGLLVNDNQGTDRPTIQFDRPGMKLYDIDLLYHYAEDGSIYIQELYDDRTTPIYVDYEWEKFPDDSRATADSSAGWLLENKYPLTAYIRGWRIRGTSGWNNPENAIDLSAASFADHTISGTGANINCAFGAVPIREECEVINAFFIMGAELTDTSGDCFISLIFWRGTAGTPLRIYVEKQILTSSASYDNCPWTGAGSGKETDHSMFGISSPPPTNEDKLKSLGIWANSADSNMTGSDSGTNGYAKIYEMAFRVDTALNINNAVIFADVTGREYQDTWGGRKTATNDIDNPVDVVESILRHELNVTTSDINTTKFDEAFTDLGGRVGGWDAGGQIVDFINSEKFLDEFCAEFGLLYYIDMNGKHSIAALKHKTASRLLYTSDFKEGSINVGYTEREQIINNFVVRYKYNPISDNYTEVIHCNKDSSSFTGADATEYEGKCQTSYDELGGVEYSKEYESKWIKWPPTAKYFLKWLVDWNYLQRNTVTGILMMDKLGIEVGDIIALDIPEYLPDTISEDAVFIVEETRITSDRTGIEVSMFEVKEP